MRISSIAIVDLRGRRLGAGAARRSPNAPWPSRTSPPPSAGSRPSAPAWVRPRTIRPGARYPVKLVFANPRGRGSGPGPCRRDAGRQVGDGNRLRRALGADEAARRPLQRRRHGRRRASARPASRPAAGAEDGTITLPRRRNRAGAVSVNVFFARWAQTRSRPSQPKEKAGGFRSRRLDHYSNPGF